MEILKLLPAGKDYLWGGTRLREEFRKDIDLTPLAETWECSVHPDGPSIVGNGTYSGRQLSEVLAEHPEYLGTKAENGELPVLVKFIDAKENLSVQVHPDDAYARVHEGQNGKTEMWYVMDAEKDAFIIYGFAHPVTKEQLKNAIERGTLDRHLRKIRVRKGDVFYVPAGLVHAIGAGCLIAEIQESSNVTYRVYDYDRMDKTGKKRELHFDQAAAVMDRQPSSDLRRKTRLIRFYPGFSGELLCRCPYFQAERLRSNGGGDFSILDASFQILLCMEGEGMLENESGYSVRYQKGDCLFLPAGSGRCCLEGESEMLKVRC